jgi:hypothetical protein
MSSSGATPAASRLAIGARSLARDRVAASERVSFPELVWAHYMYQRELHDQKLMHGPAESEFRSQMERFVAEEGPILNAYWCTNEASGVAITEKQGERVLGFLWRKAPNIRFHSATDWATHDAPAVNHVMHTTETLAIRVSEVLCKTPERIAMQWLLSVAGYLLSVVDVEGRPNKHEATKAAGLARKELQKVETYYDRAGEKTGRLIYFWGMMIGVLALGAFGVLGALLYTIPDSNKLEDTSAFFICYAMGAVGAVVSVLTRMSQRGDEAFVDYEVGRPALRRVGSFRPVIGAVFAVVLYFGLKSGLVNLETGVKNTTTFFYATLAFMAGFSERWARVLLGGATKMLGDPDDDHHAPPPAPAPSPPPGKPPEGSAA